MYLYYWYYVSVIAYCLIIWDESRFYVRKSCLPRWSHIVVDVMGGSFGTICGLWFLNKNVTYKNLKFIALVLLLVQIVCFLLFT